MRERCGDVRLIMEGGLVSNCVGLIVVDNEGRGNVKGSREDMEMSKEVRERGEIMRIRVLEDMMV